MRKDDVTGNVGSMHKDDLLSHVCRLSNDSLSRDFVEIQLNIGSVIGWSCRSLSVVTLSKYNLMT